MMIKIADNYWINSKYVIKADLFKGDDKEDRLRLTIKDQIESLEDIYDPKLIKLAMGQLGLSPTQI